MNANGTHSRGALNVGLIAATKAACEDLAREVRETGLGGVVFEGDADAFAPGKRPEVAEGGDPQVVLIDADELSEVTKIIGPVRALFPQAWILVVSDTNDPQFIIEVVRAGAREFLPKPLSAKNLREAFGRYISEHRTRDNEPGRIFSVTSAKGGTGATTVAINLATTVAQLPGTRVALVDMVFPLGDTAAYLNLKPQYNLADVVEAGDRLDATLLETFMSRSQDLAVLAGRREFQPGLRFEPKVIQRAFEVINENYSHTIVDLPLGLSEEQLHLFLDISENIIIVLTPEVTALWQTHRLLAFLRHHTAFEKVKVVLNRSQKSDEITKKDIEKTMEIPIFWSLPNDYRAVLQAMNSGQPLVNLNHTNLARSYQEMAITLSGLTPEERKGGIWGLFSG